MNKVCFSVAFEGKQIARHVNRAHKMGQGQILMVFLQLQRQIHEIKEEIKSSGLSHPVPSTRKNPGTEMSSIRSISSHAHIERSANKNKTFKSSTDQNPEKKNSNTR